MDALLVKIIFGALVGYVAYMLIRERQRQQETERQERLTQERWQRLKDQQQL